MPRRGQNIYRRKDGRWEGRFATGKANGRLKYSSVYARSYADVRIKLNDAKKRVSSGKNKSNHKSTFVEISKLWIDSISPTHKISTVIKYETLLENHVYPEFADMPFCEITDNMITNLTDRLLLSGGSNRAGLAASTVSEIITVMSCIRKYAIIHGYSPAYKGCSKAIHQEAKEIRVLSYSEEERLINFLNGNTDLTSLGILLCLYTGIRIGELCALSWDDISIEEKTLRIKGTMQRIKNKDSDEPKTKIVIIAPKSRSSCRVIPLPDIIIDKLKAYYKPDTYFLTGNSKYVEPRTMQNRFKKIIAKCGIEDTNFHSTRHTFATRCVELGFDVKSLSEILGHANVSITLNRYVHPTLEHKAMNMNKLSTLFQ